MDDVQREEIRRWRDATLLQSHGDEAAASRLAACGPLADVVQSALASGPPDPADLIGCDDSGEPLDPSHPWWGYAGPSSMEMTARRKGLPWPPDSDPNPYGKKG